MQFPERARGNLDTMESLADNCSDWLESCLAVDDKSDTEDVTTDTEPGNYGDRSSEERKGTYVRLRSASKPHSTPLTLKWLDENYEIAEGVCIPRSTLYVHYLDYCEKNDTQPVNAASFGKIIRQQFPQLTTRRLGTRGQSKYHYYGIGVKETSLYYEVSFSAKGVQSSLDGKKDSSKQIIAYSPRSKLGTLLPEFPDIKDIKLPMSVDEGKVLTFLMMYRTHCQRILDTVIRANFDEVQSFLLHFWQGMPTHIKSILECKLLVTLVGVCDSILYRAIANVLMPTVLQPLPESLTQVIRKFSVQLDTWLRQALDSLPHNLQKIKFDLARRFSQVLKRQTSLNHLCQAARTVIHSTEITSQMLDDWINVDLNSITKQTLYTMDNYCDIDYNVIVKLTQDFERLLEDQAPLESYIEWLDGMVDQCVVQRTCKQPSMLQKTARQFLLMWSCFGTRVIRDMTLHSAPSFGSFHLLHLMFDEYVLYMVENLYNQDRARELMRAVKGEQSLDFLDDLILIESHSSPNSSASTILGVDRTSVIRGPECNIQTSGQPDVLPPYVATATTETASCLEQPLAYNEPRTNGVPVSSPFSTFPTFPTSFTQQSVSHSKYAHAYHSSSTFGHNLPEVTNSNNSGTNTCDWYDWSNTGQLTSSAVTNMTYNKTTPEVDVSFKQHHGLYNEYGGSGSQGYDSYYGNMNLKRNNFDTHRMKRKLEDDMTSLTHKQNMADTYQYHVTNLI